MRLILYPRKPKRLSRRLYKKRCKRIASHHLKWLKRRRDYHQRWELLVKYPDFY